VSKRDESKGTTHEVSLLVVDASTGSLMTIPRTSLLKEWLIMYMWSSVASGPEMRSTEQGNEAFV
jgi:hypothetical protein